MKNSKYIAIAVVVLAALGIGYYVVQNKSEPTGVQEGEKLVLDTENIFFSENRMGEISLYSLDAKTEIVPPDGISCAAPIPGKKKYSGNFILEFQGQKLEIGKMEFFEGGAHDGQLIIDKWVPGDNRDWMVLYQYAGCNGSMLSIYGYDGKSEKLTQYQFKLKDGRKESQIYGDISPGFDPGSAMIDNDAFSTRAYGQDISRYRITKWILNTQENLFEEVETRVDEE